MKRLAAAAAVLCVVLSARNLPAAESSGAVRADALFALDGKDNRIAAADCGLVNGHVTFNGWLEDVAQIKGFFAPPFASSNFSLVMLFNGTPVKPTDTCWRPEELSRSGRCREWTVSSRLWPVAGERAALMEITVRNIGGLPANLNVQTHVFGNAEYLTKWQFGKPEPSRHAVCREQDGALLLENAAADVQVAVLLPDGDRNLDFDARPYGWQRRFYVAVAIGRIGAALETARRALADPAATIAAARKDWRARVDGLFAKFPTLETDNAALEQTYVRSLLHLLLNEWNVSEFALRPYYATGGINGGCVGNYLWNYGEVYRLWPMLSPDVAKAHLRKFLSLDLTHCFAYDPCADAPFGPYYPVNQEKVLLCAWAYVQETGDTAFLKERLGEGTVLDRLEAAALAHDDLTKPAVLVDYGNGNHHLELRKRWRYDGVLPDMNLRRVVCFRIAEKLCRLAGVTPKADYLARAAALKDLVRRELYDEKAGWYRVVQPDGTQELRWTMQMFKALGWDDWVLGKEEESALVRHLTDEREFLGPYGLHSLAKTDPAYDENDVDNGGPGACVSFAPAVVDRLYRSGRVQEAETIFKRLWWLGGCLPYWGDSHYADRKDYRRDTPLMNDIQGAALAQTVIFGMFGIEIADDFSIRVTPHLPEGTARMALRNVRLVGRVFDVEATSSGVTVICGEKRLEGKPGDTLVLSRIPCCTDEF